MPLAEAIRALATPGSITMTSDAQLVADVRAEQAALVLAGLRKTPPRHIPRKEFLEVAQGAHGALPVRPIAALLELARGTTLTVDRGLLRWGGRWAVLKYIGAIARRRADNHLHLAPAAVAAIGANQRRVISEELGIGFGTLIAKHWCRTRVPGTTTVKVSDFDIALHNGIAPLTLTGTRRPDYLISYPDPAEPTMTTWELLETKGTVSRSKAIGQLGRAVTQLSSVTIDGAALTSIAVSTVSTDTTISTFAVDPESPRIRWRVDADDLARSREEPRDSRSRVPRLDLDPSRIFSRATNVENATLARYAGLDATAQSWLPDLSDESLPTAPREEAREIWREQEFVGSEVAVRGTRSGKTLRIFTGVETGVAHALRSLDPSELNAAQTRFARTRENDLAAAETTTGVAAVATDADGSILQLTVED